jgi:hypothetical protein
MGMRVVPIVLSEICRWSLEKEQAVCLKCVGGVLRLHFRKLQKLKSALGE